VATAAAKRYAKSVFELAQADGDIEAWARRLASIKELFADPRMAAYLSNPTVATEERQATVSESRLLDKEGTNLAMLLVESGRVAEAADIETEFQRLSDEAAGRVRAIATTAVELSAADRDHITRELSRRLSKDVRLSVTVDPRILGGLRLQFGDHVIDASIATRLEQLRRRLIVN
jgi:F-type H+-transporting ATPase subunit delta